MRTWIPWEEIEAEWMERPGFAEGCEQAQRELEEEIAMYGTIGNPKPTPRPPRPLFTRSRTKERTRATAKLKKTAVA